MTGSVSSYIKENEELVELLATIDVHGSRFGELDDRVGISHDTLSTRLSEATALGLVEPEGIQGERGATHQYTLTPKGARLRRQLQMLGAVETFEVLQDFRQRAERHEEEFTKWVKDMEESGELDDKSRNHDALAFLRKRAAEFDE